MIKNATYAAFACAGSLTLPATAQTRDVTCDAYATCSPSYGCEPTVQRLTVTLSEDDTVMTREGITADLPFRYDPNVRSDLRNATMVYVGFDMAEDNVIEWRYMGTLDKGIMRLSYPPDFERYFTCPIAAFPAEAYQQ